MPQPNELLCIVNDTLPPKIYTNTAVLTYPIPFSFVNQNDVVVYSRTDSVDTILNNQAFDSSGTYTINQGVNPALVTFTTPPGGDELVITRLTDICNMLVVYEAGASIRAEDLNAGNTQLLNLIQENYGRIIELKERFGELLTTPLYQTDPLQDETSWTNSRIPSGAAALAQLNVTNQAGALDPADYYDGKLWYQPSDTTQAIAVNTPTFVAGSSLGLNPVWPGNDDLDSIPNVTQTYNFNQNVSGSGTGLRLSVNITDSQITLVSLVDGGQGWEIGDTAETAAIPVSNGTDNTGSIRLRVEVANVDQGEAFLKIKEGGQANPSWRVIAANDPSVQPFTPKQTFFVNTEGNDQNSGLTPGTAFRTIKRAVFECNKFTGNAEVLTYRTSNGDEPKYNNLSDFANGIPGGHIRYTCTTATGLSSGDIVTIPEASWTCSEGTTTYPKNGPTQFAVTIIEDEPNNLYIDVGPSNFVHTFVSTTDTNIKVRRSRLGDNFQIQVAPGSYDEMTPLVIYAKNLCITGSSLRNTYIHPRIIDGVQPDGSPYIVTEKGDVTDDQGNTIKVYDSECRTMFYCDSGTYINNLTVCGLKAFYTRDSDGVVVRGGPTSIDPNTTYGLPPNTLSPTGNQGWIAALRPSDSTLGSLVAGNVPDTYVNDVPGSFISKSPYIQNCTNFSDINIDNGVNFNPQFLTGEGGDTASGPTGGGILCDGDSPDSGSPLRSFVVDAFTQISLNGPGILCTNLGYSQLVSFFGTFCWYHAKALNGGQLNLSNCTTDFGQYGLIADQGTMGSGGTNDRVFTGQIQSDVAAATPPNNAEVLNVSDILWNNTAVTQGTLEAGRLRITATFNQAPVVGQSLRLTNVTFAEWDASLPAAPGTGTGLGAYTGTKIQVPAFGEADTFVILSVDPSLDPVYSVEVQYKQEVINLGSTNTYTTGAYVNTTTDGDTVYAGFVPDQNLGRGLIQVPTTGSNAGIPSIFIRVKNLGNTSSRWSSPRKPEPGPTQIIEIEHSEGSVFYPILTASRVGDTDEFDLEIYSPFSSFDRRNLGLIYDVDEDMSCNFYLQSYISTGGHTFEFVGSGTDYDAHPDLGGEGNPNNQVVELGGVTSSGSTPKDEQINLLSAFNQGRVWQSSTDETGTFQVGDTFKVDQKTGLISIDPSVIVAPAVDITEDLDMKQYAIVTTFGSDTNLLLQPKGTGGLVISNSDAARPGLGPSTSPIIGPIKERSQNDGLDYDVVTQEDIGYDPNQVPVSQYLGRMAFQDQTSAIALNPQSPAEGQLVFEVVGTDLKITINDGGTIKTGTISIT